MYKVSIAPLYKVPWPKDLFCLVSLYTFVIFNLTLPHTHFFKIICLGEIDSKKIVLTFQFFHKFILTSETIFPSRSDLIIFWLRGRGESVFYRHVCVFKHVYLTNVCNTSDILSQSLEKITICLTIFCKFLSLSLFLKIVEIWFILLLFFVNIVQLYSVKEIRIMKM